MKPTREASAALTGERRADAESPPHSARQPASPTRGGRDVPGDGNTPPPPLRQPSCRTVRKCPSTGWGRELRDDSESMGGTPLLATAVRQDPVRSAPARTSDLPPGRLLWSRSAQIGEEHLFAGWLASRARRVRMESAHPPVEIRPQSCTSTVPSPSFLRGTVPLRTASRRLRWNAGRRGRKRSGCFPTSGTPVVCHATSPPVLRRSRVFPRSHFRAVRRILSGK